TDPKPLPLPHHLVYFEPTKPPSDLLPDGTNPDQSPGEPFVRRMWAGGRVQYNNAKPLLLDGRRGVCVEGIRDVSIKGKPGDEKVFVGIERRLGVCSASELERLAAAQRDPARLLPALEDAVRSRLWQADEGAFGDASAVERRSIVFMRERTPEQLAAATAAARAPEKILRPQHEPEYAHTIVPNAQLLFRYSALTFNAHAIHLDPHYCRAVEGHRNLLFHGPLSFTFLLVLLRDRLAKEEGGREVIRSVEYRNLAPLYAYEPVKFCGRKDGEGKWEIWTETPEGGVAVKGSVRTERV
ncbi:hypothetical protein LTR28_014094, partial [Elasticomyces elasticus]